MTRPLAAVCALAVLLAPGAARGAGKKLPAKRTYSGDLVLSVPLLHGWVNAPHELAHMNDHPRDLWASHSRGGQDIKFTYSERSWEKLRELYMARRGAEAYETETGVRAVILFDRPDASGAVSCEGSRYEFTTHGLVYADILYLLDHMACKTRKGAKKKPAPKKRISAEPEL